MLSCTLVSPFFLTTFHASVQFLQELSCSGSSPRQFRSPSSPTTTSLNASPNLSPNDGDFGSPSTSFSSFGSFLAFPNSNLLSKSLSTTSVASAIAPVHFMSISSQFETSRSVDELDYNDETSNQMKSPIFHDDQKWDHLPNHIFLWGSIPDIATTPLVAECFVDQNEPRSVFCLEKATCVLTKNGQLYLFDIFGGSDTNSDSSSTSSIPSSSSSSILSNSSSILSNASTLTSSSTSSIPTSSSNPTSSNPTSSNPTSSSSSSSNPTSSSNPPSSPSPSLHLFKPIHALSQEKIVSVAGGGSHVLALSKSGELWAWGSNEFGQLGLGDTTDHQQPQKSPFVRKLFKNCAIRQIAAGGFHSLALTDSGQVWSWGKGAEGVLGMGEDDNHNKAFPRPVGGSLSRQSVVAIACGYRHTLCLTDIGRIYGFGCNTTGQLGLPESVQHQMSPRLIRSLDRHFVKYIDCGFSHSVALTDTRLYSWGMGSQGQLGHGSNKPASFRPRRVRLPERSARARVVEVKCGGFHNAILMESGNLYTWGSNKFGQLGIGDTKNRNEPCFVSTLSNIHIKRISCGFWQTVIVGSTNIHPVVVDDKQQKKVETS